MTQPVEPGHSLQLGTDRLVVMVADVIAGASEKEIQSVALVRWQYWGLVL